MGKFLIMQKAETNALLLIPANSSDVWDYISSGFTEQKTGTKRECLEWAQNFWEEKEILEDEQVFLTD